MRILSLILFLVLLSACTSEDNQLHGTKENGSSVDHNSNHPPQEKADTSKMRPPLIGEMHWPDVHSYCLFFKEGHKFNFDDKATWKFIFVTLFDAPKDQAYLKINNSRQAVKMISSSKSKNTEKRIYQVISDKSIEIEVNIKKGRSGYEHTEYSGAIRSLKPVASEPIKFYGDCGV